MKKDKKKTTMKETMEKSIEIIKNFAESMGYETIEYDYTTYARYSKENNRPAHAIELIGTYDCEGEPYTWAWYTDTYTEII